MAAQTREQGRYLGGRPPYGYRLADAGPHPNKAHAAWGRRAHRLETDPATEHPAHAALVSEADFIAAQQLTAPRGPAGPAVRRYLLAGLLACGQCGRRLESAWSNGKPAYRCRHGYTSATSPDPARPRNTHVREDQILPHLAAIGILLARSAGTPGPKSCGVAQLTRPADAGALIDQLRADSVALTYDPDDRTLHVTGQDTPGGRPVPGRGRRMQAPARSGRRTSRRPGWPARSGGRAWSGWRGA